VEPVTEYIDVKSKLGLLVGINKYEDPLISPLNFSVNDVEGLYEILIDPEKGKCNKDDIELLSDNNYEKPTRNKIVSKLRRICRRAEPRDIILFYFSGHGYEKDGKPYLLCSDTYLNAVEETAIPVEVIRKTMEESDARVKIIILDACHSGMIKGVKDSGKMTEQLFKAFFPPPQGFAVLSSCKLGEYSYEWSEKEHSVFSYYLLEGLKGGADKDEDGIVTLIDAYQFTSENVRKWAFQRGLEQNPTLEARISGDIPLTFTKRILGKEEPIDKSIIQRVIIRSEEREVDKTIQEFVEQLCGSMLQFFKPSEIKKLKWEELRKAYSPPIAEVYKFPYGEIHVCSEWYPAAHWFTIYFEYKHENWTRIDQIINSLGVPCKSIEYVLNKRMDLEKLVNKCREKNFKVVAYSPEHERIKAITTAWLFTETTFKNEKDSSSIRIYRTYGTFSTGFYSTLSPENIIEFIKDCLQ
jgi:hypothetical protein